MSALVQQCGSSSNPAARMIRALAVSTAVAVLVKKSKALLRFPKNIEIKKNTAVPGTDLDAAGCGWPACTSRLDDKRLL